MSNCFVFIVLIVGTQCAESKIAMGILTLNPLFF